MTTPLPRLTVPPDVAAARALADRALAGRWRPGVTRDGVEVTWAHLHGERVRTYRVTTHHPVPRPAMARWLSEGLFRAFARLNRHWHSGGVITPSPLVVRTAFALPRPMAPREFVHGLSCTELDGETTVVAYTPAEHPELPTLGPAWVRCPMMLSGQRITDTEEGCRVEHVMGYALAGRVRPWVQNRLLHRSHLDAYLHEWAPLVARSRRPGGLAKDAP
jgi:hypothetical protein